MSKKFWKMEHSIRKSLKQRRKHSQKGAWLYYTPIALENAMANAEHRDNQHQPCKDPETPR
jgi:hypothetical protein